MTDTETDTMPMATSISYCAEEVRANDRDRFLCALFAPEEKREALFALLAFNIEIAKTRETVSEPMLGLMRLQWWHEAIEGMFAGQLRHHAVLEALDAVKRDTPLSQDLFLELIRAREGDVEGTQPASMEGLEYYARVTSGNLLLLMLEALHVDDDEVKHAAVHAGIGWAMIGLLRSARIHFRQSYVMFPADLMEETAMRPDNFGSAEFLEASLDIVKTIADRIEFHLNEAKRLARNLPRKVRAEAMPVLLVRTLAEGYLRRIAKAGYDVFSKDIEGTRFTLQLRLLKSAMLKEY